MFAFGQPVFLEVALQNRTQAPVDFPAEVLDQKAGFLEVLVQRRSGAPSRGRADAVSFVPILQRCYDLDVTAADTVAPGGMLRNNLNLTFGSGGFALPNPVSTRSPRC